MTDEVAVMIDARDPLEMSKAAEDYFELVAMPPVEIKGKSGLHTPYAVVGEKLTLSR